MIVRMGRTGSRWSLRQAITFSSAAKVMLLLVAFTVGYIGLRRAYDHRTSDRLRFEHLSDASHELLTALVDQEVGLRGYLGGGDREFLEPLQHGQADEAAAWSRLRDGADSDEIRRAIDALDAAVAAWHRTIVDPEMLRRAQGPLDDLTGALRDGKRLFDRLRARHDDLADAIHDHADEQLAADGDAIARIGYLSLAIAALAIALTFVITRWVLRHTAAPLAELARRAEAGEPFPAPGASEIREVHALAGSLYQLDATVFVREQALAAAHDQAVALTRFGAHVQQLSDEDELHDAFVRSAHDLLAPSKVQVMVRNGSKNRLDVVRPAMTADEQLQHPILGDPMKCRAVRTLREVGCDADDATACHCALGVPATGSYVCLPMLAAGELVGVTNLQSEAPGHFSADRVRMMQGYAGFTSATLSSLRLIAATRERALRDGLTGAHNRAFLSEYLTKALASARRRSAALAVLMIDLDHFKRINDEHGHPIGDAAIIALARCLQAQTRANDAVVRYGGEEFCVLLVDVDAATASATAERIRAAIERVGVAELGPILRASIGLALFPEHATDEQGLIAGADAALYRAKHAGRNRVELARAAA
jgi:diguanylate cyclase (GGDEF)-like protein